MPDPDPPTRPAGSSEAETICNPRRTHPFRPAPALGRYACTECVFGEFHTVHTLPEGTPDNRYERPEQP